VAVLAVGSEEEVGDDIVDGGAFGVAEPETAAEEVEELQGEAVLEDLVVEQHLGGVELVALHLLLPQRPLQQVRLRVNQAADAVPLHRLLPLLREDALQRLVDRRRLLEVLEPAHCALQDDQSELEDVQRPLRLQVGRLRNGALHEVLLGHVHLEDAASGGGYFAAFWGVLRW
jgi:hypothetical protein